MINGELSPEFLNPFAPWIIEFFSPVIWVCLFAYCWRESRRADELSFGMLLLLGAMTMHWQEWYADWGAYLLYNPKFQLMPWGSTWWTSPNKPWFMPFSYGWFYYFSMVGMLALIAKLQNRKPDWKHVTCVIAVSAPFFYLWDLCLEWTAAITGWWSYVHYMGPAWVAEKGNFPFLHPIAMYTVSGVVMVLALSYRDANGRPAFESLFGANRMRPGLAREVARLLTWSIILNLIYWFSFVLLLCLVRMVIGVPSASVP